MFYYFLFNILQYNLFILKDIDLDHVTVLFCGIVQICEDVPQVLDSDVPGLAERPINIFLPRLFQVTHA